MCIWRGNPRDGCYFHQESNDNRMKKNDDQDGLLPRLVFVVSLKRAVFNGSAKWRFNIFRNFSCEEQLTVSFISCWFYRAVDWSQARSMRCFKITKSGIPILEPSFFLTFRKLESKVASLSSVKRGNFTPDFTNWPISFKSNFRFPWRFQNSEFLCVFGMISFTTREWELGTFLFLVQFE